MEKVEILASLGQYVRLKITDWKRCTYIICFQKGTNVMFSLAVRTKRQKFAKMEELPSYHGIALLKAAAFFHDLNFKLSQLEKFSSLLLP